VPLAAADRSRIGDIEHALAVYVVGGPPALTQVLAPLREMLHLELTVAYGVEEVGGEFRLSFAEAEGGCGVAVVRKVLGGFMGGRWVEGLTAFDHRRPERWNRNRVLVYEDLARRGIRSTPTSEVALPKLGVHVSQQLRVLVCEGPSLLAWVGGFRNVRDEPYTQRDRRVFGALVPFLRMRLALERTLASAGPTRVALEVAMEAIAGPAFLLTDLGTPILANGAGRAELDADPLALRTKLADAVRTTRSEEFRVIPVRSPGCPLRHLAIGRTTPRVRSLAHAAARRWGLSARQQQVLGWLVEGASNARVGAELRIAERTVETHVTAILGRAQVGSRAHLIAEVLKG
jgi:DNA-binding CsgD family transcriptional regulator